MGWPTEAIDTTSMDSSADDPSQARAEIKKMAENVNDIKDSRNAASGIAPLDTSSLLPVTNLPTIPVNKGGTGQTTYTVGDILYASASGVLTKLPAATEGYVLTSNGPGFAPSWQQAGGGLVSGTRMPFNQTAAPTGWTKDTTINDSLMRIVSGTVGSGGTQDFSAFNEITSTAAHSLTYAQLPRSGSASGDPSAKSAQGSTANAILSGHSHGLTHDIKYNDFIIAVKD